MAEKEDTAQSRPKQRQALAPDADVAKSVEASQERVIPHRVFELLSGGDHISNPAIKGLIEKLESDKESSIKAAKKNAVDLDGSTCTVSNAELALGRVKALKDALSMTPKKDESFLETVESALKTSEKLRNETVASILTKQEAMERGWSAFNALYSKNDQAVPIRVLNCSLDWIERNDAVSLLDEAITPATTDLEKSAKKVVVIDPLDHPEIIYDLAKSGQKNQCIFYASLPDYNEEELKEAFRPGGDFASLSKSNDNFMQFITLSSNYAIIRQSPSDIGAKDLHLAPSAIIAGHQMEQDLKDEASIARSCFGPNHPFKKKHLGQNFLFKWATVEREFSNIYTGGTVSVVTSREGANYIDKLDNLFVTEASDDPDTTFASVSSVRVREWITQTIDDHMYATCTAMHVNNKLKSDIQESLNGFMKELQERKVLGSDRFDVKLKESNDKTEVTIHLSIPYAGQLKKANIESEAVYDMGEEGVGAQRKQ